VILRRHLAKGKSLLARFLPTVRLFAEVHMKESALLTLSFGCAIVLSACVGPRVTVHSPVGPDPSVAARPSEMGNLEVFVGDMENPDFATDPSSYATRAEYKIYDGRGGLIKTVDFSKSADFGIDPRIIPLPPGRYGIKVETDAANDAWTRLPVIIESGRTTEVHLDGWTPPAGTPDANIVYSPAGRPLGWRANGMQ
jgi:hypothetical protein